MLGRAEKAEPVVSIPMPDKQWEHVAIDVCGPFANGKNVVVLVDYMSKWPEATIMSSVTSVKIINWLTEIFARFGFPKVLTSDNGSQFVSREFEKFLSSNGVKHRRVVPYWPRANGLVERLNASFLKPFKAAILEGFSMHEALVTFLRVYRNTHHCTTGVTPASSMFGREVRISYS